MKSRAWIWLALGLALAGCGHTDSSSDTGGGTAPPDTGTIKTGDTRIQAIVAKLGDGVAANGSDLYTRDCAQCHLASGEGGGGFPSLIEKLPGLTDEQLVTYLFNGLPNPEGGVGMPPYNTVYTNQQFADVIAYIEQQFNSSGS
jgi:mono/diheme cytochrome c family protein